MMGVLVEVRQRTEAFTLRPGKSDAVLHEGPALLLVTCSPSALVTLNDEPLRSAWRASERVTIVQVDFTNQIGFHRLSVREGNTVTDFDFSTSSAKATWDEILAMADLCVRSYFSYRHQFS